MMEAALVWYIISVIAVWDSVWKGIAMWKAGRNNQLAWYVCILIFNTAGILPLVYLLFFQKTQVKKRKKVKKK